MVQSAGFMDLGSDTKELFQLAKIRSGGDVVGGFEKKGVNSFKCREGGFLMLEGVGFFQGIYYIYYYIYLYMMII